MWMSYQAGRRFLLLKLLRAGAMSVKRSVCVESRPSFAAIGCLLSSAFQEASLSSWETTSPTVDIGCRKGEVASRIRISKCRSIDWY
jgi:hypothetical protein